MYVLYMLQNILSNLLMFHPLNSIQLRMKITNDLLVNVFR